MHLARKPAGAIEKIRLGAHIGNDPGPPGRDHVAGDALAQGIFAAFNFFRSHPDCRLRAQPAGGFIQQDQRPAVHIQLVGNDLHHFRERLRAVPAWRRESGRSR